MNILDTRTIMLGYLITNALSAIVMFSFWRQNRRLPGSNFWLADFLLQFIGIMLILLRGSVSDFLSMVVSNTLLIGGLLALLIGFEKYTDRISAQWLNYFGLAVFFAIQAYFSLAQPSLQFRNINIAAFIMFFSLQSAWLLLRRADVNLRQDARSTGLILVGFGVLSLIRILVDLAIHPGDDFFKSGFYDSILLMSYQTLYLSLTFSLLLLVNRRLNLVLQNDLTKLNLAAESLRASEEKFSKAFQTSPFAITITNPRDGRFLEVNDAFCAITGYSREEALNSTTLSLNLWVNLAERVDALEMLKTNAKVWQREIPFRKKNGEIFVSLFSCQNIQWGQSTCVFASIEDISERKQKEKALRENEALLRTMAENYPNSYVSIIEEDLTIGYTAGQEFKKLNLDPRQFTGLTLEQVFGEHTPLVKENYLKTFSGAETQFELFINGQYQSYRTVPLIDSTGRIHRILSVVENITERKQAEKFLKEIIAQNPMSIQVLDKDGFTLETNLAYKLLFGSIPPAGYSIFNDLQLAQKGMGEIFDRLRTGEVVHFPDVNFNPHDSIPELPDVPVWVRTIGFPISDSHEKPERFILMHENITVRKQAEDALHESEERYKLMFESAPLAINITRGTDIIYANPSYLKMFGFSNLDELKNFASLELFIPESRAQILENIQRRAKGLPVPNSYEAECFRKDRTRFPILMHLTRTTFADGPATVGFIIDITERKLAEKALRENELKYRTLFETADDANLLFTGDQWVDCNGGALRVFGCTREEIIGAHPRRFSPPMQPDGRSSEEESIKKINLAFAGEPQYFEWEHCHADGTPFPAEVSLNRMDLEGKPYIQAIVRDISERKRAEQKLQESENNYRTLVENLQTGLVVHAPDTSILYSNPRASQLLGLTPDQMRGKSAIDPAWSFIREDGARMPLEEYPVNQALAKTTPLSNLILGILKPDQEGVTWVQCNAHQDWDLDGKLQQVVVTFSDITQRKQTEEALKKSELASRRMADQLDVVYRMSTDLVSGLDFDQLIQNLYQKCQRIGDTDTFYLALYDEENDTISFPVFFKDGERLRIESRRIGENPGFSGHIINHRETLYLPDTFNLPSGLAGVRQAGIPTRSFIGVPLFLQEQIVGILSIQSNKTDAYSADQTFMLELLSRQVAIAIQNSQLYQLAQQEIAERKRAEDALQKSEARMVSAIRAAGLCLYEEEGAERENRRMTFFDAGMRELLGVPADQEHRARDYWIEHIHPDDLQNIMIPEIARFEDQGENLVSAEYRYLNEKRGVIWFRHVAHALKRNDKGEVLRLVGAIYNIIERKQAEQKLYEYSEHLEEMVETRTRELTDAQEQLVQQERLATLGRLAGGVSQELRNPLGIINNAIYYLRMVQPEADETIKEYLDIIEGEAHNADKIVSDLLDFSSNELVDREPIAVSELVSDALQHFPFPENVQVTLNLPENLPTVYIDPRQMTQVLGNLVLNACQAMNNGGRLTVDSRQLTVDGQSSVVIAVKDTGTGITPENMKKLFEPLFTTKPKGIGLGLAVSKKLAEANGGRIEVESEAGKGSVFTLRLPVHSVIARVE